MNPREVDNVKENELIFNNVAGFDNFVQAFVTTFIVCTLESWSLLMYNYADASDYPITSYIFFSSLVFVGSFFILNLILAQIMDSYMEC